MSKLQVLLSIIAFCALGQSYISDVEQVFKDNEIIPDVIIQAPQRFLKVTYDKGLMVNSGNELTPAQVKIQPIVEWEANEKEYYTLMMVDPDAISRANPIFREFRHWLVANIPCKKIEQGDVIAAYMGSAPPKDTGLHRYVILLYKQPGKLELDEARVPKNSSQGRRNFKAAKFADKYNLGAPIAGNFFQAQYDN